MLNRRKYTHSPSNRSSKLDFLSKILDFLPAMHPFQILGVENDPTCLNLPCIIAYLQSYATFKNSKILRQNVGGNYKTVLMPLYFHEFI